MVVSEGSGSCNVNQGEDCSLRRARLYWQCRRGMLELDMLLQSFLDHHYDQASLAERDAFENLLQYPDSLLFEYFMGRVIPTDKQLASVVIRLRTLTPA